ncbi:hypothetical protein N0V84_007228 [Fusarium piperis]|uniref:Uncharacterized protein n=1 Tax=Fusarium piperis TaxID=1435070 RepID=A0A9W8WAE9_9HYPO|nr:hypothetical protein N0V84_007228 [Fusarium piperis]
MKSSTLPLLGLLWLPLAFSYCPPTGPVLPPPKVLADGNLTESLAESLEDLVRSSSCGTFRQLFLRQDYQQQRDSLQVLPYPDKTSVEKVTRSSTSRVARATEIFTVLALLLQEDINLEDLGLKQLSELAKNKHYKVITLRMLLDRSILRYDLPSTPRADLWLKPTSFLSTAQGAFGMPWEIYRVSDPTPSSRHVDVYTKASDGVLYAPYIVITPEYDAGITINTAKPGSYATERDLLNLMVQEVVRCFKSLAREQARNQCTGKYTSDKYSLVLTIDQAISGGNNPNVDARIYPTSESQLWRVVFKDIV